MLTKTAILIALDRWIRQRPGLDFGNYGNWASYRAEVRSIGKDLQHARELLRYVELRDSITADMLREAFRAYSGRLTLTETDTGAARLDYCTGQYWPTEYRRAACAVLSSAIWGYWRDHCTPAPGSKEYARYKQSPGDWLRDYARREFGRGIAFRWFN